jgi:hypothetical protein
MKCKSSMATKSKNVRDIPLNSGYQDNMTLDTAIIGAGCSGLYSGYRILSDLFAAGAIPLGGAGTHIFDMGDRIAGRLESVVLPQMDIAGELGGMRYLTSQAIVTTLIETVFKDWLTPVEFPMGKDERLLVYLRKQRLKASDWDEAHKANDKLVTRYFLNPDDVGYSADELFNKVIYDVLMADPWCKAKYGSQIIQDPKKPYNYTFKINSVEWDDIKPNLTYQFDGPYKGMKVNDLGFWNLVKDRVSEEGYSFLNQAGGYYSNTINWNAAEAFPYMVGDFSNAETTYKTIQGGYDQIAYALATAYTGYQGSQIWIKNRLHTIERSDKRNYRYKLVMHNIDANKRWNVYADKVILGMPRRSLELLDQECFLFKDKKMKYQLESVIKEPSFKLLMGFEAPWWRNAPFNIDSGHSITDLPMRQCYYFGKDLDDQRSMFLASYNDMQTVTFWKALDDNQVDRFEPKIQGLPPLKNKASAVMVAEAMNQVRELHGDASIPDPYVALYKDWADDPFGGGYHAWKAAYNIKEAMEFMRKPLKDDNIFICGEAYSDQQGWVEGALCVAEKMLQDHFGLKGPAWLDPTYYLGW